MLQALKELGELGLELEGKGTEDVLSILVQDPNQKGNYPKVLVIVFRESAGDFHYSHVSLEDTDRRKVPRYLYRRKSPNGPDFTPTAKVTDIEKTFKNKILGWFRSVGPDHPPLVVKMKNALVKESDVILSDLRSKWREMKPSLKKGQDSLITLGVEGENGLAYIGDFKEFREHLRRAVKEKYERIKRKNHVCAACGEWKDEVHGAAIPITFYTLDKPGYIAGGFDSASGWKNSPICFECSLKIEEGKRLLDDTPPLKPTMGGQRYYLIPKSVVGGEGLKEIVGYFRHLHRTSDTLHHGSLKDMSAEEEEILEELGRFKDVVNFNFMFFREEKGKFEILLLVEDVLPSRIRAIFEAKRAAEDREIFDNVKLKKNEYGAIRFGFEGLRRLVPSRKAFLDVVDRIFRGSWLEPKLLFSWFMKPVRERFVEGKYLKPIVLRSFVTLLFFKEAGCIKMVDKPSPDGRKGGEVMNTPYRDRAEQFFSSFDDTFPGSVYKVAFLLGALAQKLLNIQHKERGSTPFRKKLRGLRMREEDMKALFKEIQDKLEAYGKNYYRALETLIASYFLEAGRKWAVSTDELNFYFVLGMNLSNELDEALGMGWGKVDEAE